MSATLASRDVPWRDDDADDDVLLVAGRHGEWPARQHEPAVAGGVSSQPVLATGSPETLNLVGSPVIGLTSGEPSPSRPFM